MFVSKRFDVAHLDDLTVIVMVMESEEFEALRSAAIAGLGGIDDHEMSAEQREVWRALMADGS